MWPTLKSYLHTTAKTVSKIENENRTSRTIILISKVMNFPIIYDHNLLYTNYKWLWRSSFCILQCSALIRAATPPLYTPSTSSCVLFVWWFTDVFTRFFIQMLCISGCTRGFCEISLRRALWSISGAEPHHQTQTLMCECLDWKLFKWRSNPSSRPGNMSNSACYETSKMSGKGHWSPSGVTSNQYSFQLFGVWH